LIDNNSAMWCSEQNKLRRSEIYLE
jgi:hypothetical protein